MKRKIDDNTANALAQPSKKPLLGMVPTLTITPIRQPTKAPVEQSAVARCPPTSAVGEANKVKRYKASNGDAVIASMVPVSQAQVQTVATVVGPSTGGKPKTTLCVNYHPFQYPKSITVYTDGSFFPDNQRGGCAVVFEREVDQKLNFAVPVPFPVAPAPRGTRIDVVRPELYAALAAVFFVETKLGYPLCCVRLIIKSDSKIAIGLLKWMRKLPVCCSKYLLHQTNNKDTDVRAEFAWGNGDKTTFETADLWQWADVLDYWWTYTRHTDIDIVWVKAHQADFPSVSNNGVGDYKSNSNNSNNSSQSVSSSLPTSVVAGQTQEDIDIYRNKEADALARLASRPADYEANCSKARMEGFPLFS